MVHYVSELPWSEGDFIAGPRPDRTRTIVSGLELNPKGSIEKPHFSLPGMVGHLPDGGNQFKGEHYR
ncbi:hypothetical protein [Nucisporomicrobium flavum]|uniref:hypothetical protein n=1 Tax=Nucisporomicrobium flavum TaxID=2785915 RepID=UPI0018F3900D|nr:hypothetical protein [Nucisporomicrobium flavum]